MSEEIRRALGQLFVQTGRAHHEATGGINPGWAQWYAEYLHPRLGDVVGLSPSVEDIERWITSADEEYRRVQPAESWPRYYVELFLKEFEGQ